jgi:adenine-specific DNA methylase
VAIAARSLPCRHRIPVACWDFISDNSGKGRSKLVTDMLSGSPSHLLCANASQSVPDSSSLVVTDPPYVGNVNYSELPDFLYVWLRLALKDRYSWFAPEYTPKVEEIVENRTRGKSRENYFYNGLSAVFHRIQDQLPSQGLLVFTFHHTDQEGTVWEGLLQALCDTGFEITAIYPVYGEAESSLHLMDKENVSYDLIHVCRKRLGGHPARGLASGASGVVCHRGRTLRQQAAAGAGCAADLHRQVPGAI